MSSGDMKNDSNQIPGKEKQSGLGEVDIALLDAQVKVPESNAGYKTIYRFAHLLDVVVMLLSTICAAAAGTCLPLMTVIFGSLTGEFANFTPTAQQLFLHRVHTLLLDFVYIGLSPGIASVVCTSLCIQGFTWTGKRISKRLRTAYFETILQQNIGFFDSIGAGEVATRIMADAKLIQDGISQKVGLAIIGLSSFLAAEIIAFVVSWRLALVLLSVPIVIILWMAAIGKQMKVAQMGAIRLYASSATLAEEAISSIRDVMAYGTRHRFVEKYGKSLEGAMAMDFKAKALLGVFIGGLMWAMLASFALGCWAGERFLNAGDATVSHIVTVLLASVTASITFGSVSPSVQAFGAAGVAANRIFAILDRKSPIPTGKGAEPKATLSGNIMFQGVSLVYPSRRDDFVLEDISLETPSGKSTAIVGPSGSGKSSLFALLERFYSPLRGKIFIDGYDIKDLSVSYLRSQIRMVSQEPFIFNTTVYENICCGLAGTSFELADSSTKTRMVEEAARNACAHSFIADLPQGYNTVLGENGNLLSGGERQRIGIARAIVSNPAVLLLDEATSALDSESEGSIQIALRAASGGRTTITVAHRLSTIKNADQIVVLDCGRITEMGTHDTLINRKGAYASLVSAQTLEDKSTKEIIEPTPTISTADPLKKNNETLIASPGGTSPPSGSNDETGMTPRSTLLKFLWKLNHPERQHILLGCIGSFFSSLAYPFTAIFFGNSILGLRDSSATTGGKSIEFWTGVQFLLSCVILIAYLVKGIPLAFASSRLIARARSAAFAAILRQDMAFFAKNDQGALLAFLSQQANQLNGLSGSILGAVIDALFAVLAGCAVADSYGWKLGLIATSLMPLIIVSGYLRYRLLAEMEQKMLQKTTATSTVLESIRGIRTVVSFGLQHTFSLRYKAQLEIEYRTGLSWDLGMAVLYGFSQSIVIFSSALLFWYGGTHLIATGEYNVRDFLICYIATIYSAQAAGSIFSHAPDVAGAQAAATRLKALMETVPDIDPESEDGDSADNLVGDVLLNKVSFAYPDHSSLALREVSLRAAFGNFIALVGVSGSGKSSMLNLLERFYDPREGKILADGKDLRQYKLRGYRKRLAIVAQESTLYSGTVRENITTDTNAEDDAILNVCRQAHIYDFVQSLPEGLDTLVGPRGSQVSVGQKQRLAIAKALLRNPKILLLDEATSALDSKSEVAVQKALDLAAHGRTTIAVAHHLSSVAHADCIFVFEKGTVIEYGSHQELMGRKGRYWEFVQLQNLGK